MNPDTTFVLNPSTPGVAWLCKNDPRLAKVILQIGELRYTCQEVDPYAFLVHEIIEQMLSIKAGEKIYNRLLDACGGCLSPETIANLPDETIRICGTSASKVRYIKSLTAAVLNGTLDLASLDDLTDGEALKALTKINGIGNWTAKMYLIFVLNRQDILPTEDATFIRAFKWLYGTDALTAAEIEKKAAPWKPYRSIAARYLYEALDSGLTAHPLIL